MYDNFSRARSQYNREAILSASPAKLLTMLYDRLLLDLNRAEAAQQQQRWPDASAELVHAQAIIAELTSSLDTEVWSGGKDLQALYSFITTLLITANTRRDAVKTREAIEILEPLRATWHEAAQSTLGGHASLPAQAAEPAAAPRGVLGVG